MPKVPDADMENEETDHNDDGKEQGNKETPHEDGTGKER
jgi:hypothetical protein